MARIQIPMEISDEAFLGLTNGKFVRHGGVIYNKTGGVVEHLKDAPIKKYVEKSVEKVASKSSTKIGNFFGNISMPTIKDIGKIGLYIGGAVVVGGYIYYGIKSLIESNEKETSIEVVSDIEFNNSLKEYIEAAKNGNISIPVIKSLREQIYKISESDENNVVVIDIKQLRVLISYIGKYTEDLAKANNYFIKDEDRANLNDDNIINIDRYLNIQENILKEAS